MASGNFANQWLEFSVAMIFQKKLPHIPQPELADALALIRQGCLVDQRALTVSFS